MPLWHRETTPLVSTKKRNIMCVVSYHHYLELSHANLSHVQKCAVNY